MTYNNSHSSVPDSMKEELSQLPLEYGCSFWRQSSQVASDIYDSGVKLWTKVDLADIENQLERSYTKKFFTVRRIDGTKVQIRNLNYEVKQPIWKPHVKFQDYWRLVKEQPAGSQELYQCSYLVEWSNQTIRNFRLLPSTQDQAFHEKKQMWENSMSCGSLNSSLKELLGTRTVTKIICFGLGDMCRSLPDWVLRQKASTTDKPNITDVDCSMIQHSVAICLAEICCNSAQDPVQLLAQDPDYSVEATELLERNGFKIVGRFGAGGFADVDEYSVVFSPFVSAPVKQIIADIARPVFVISTGFEAFNDHEKPWADAESPRTKQMWQAYRSSDFPIDAEENARMGKLHKLKVYVRKPNESL